MNDSAITPSADKCSNGTGITAEYNSTVEFLVPNVAYNITAVDPSSSASASATGAAKSDASRFEMYVTGVWGLMIMIMGIGSWAIL